MFKYFGTGQAQSTIFNLFSKIWNNSKFHLFTTLLIPHPLRIIVKSTLQTPPQEICRLCLKNMAKLMTISKNKAAHRLCWQLYSFFSFFFSLFLFLSPQLQCSHRKIERTTSPGGFPSLGKGESKMQRTPLKG